MTATVRSADEVSTGALAPVLLEYFVG